MANIGIIVPRLGAEVVGGSERFAFDAATTLAAAGHHVDIVTTTALDYRTWDPHYEAGTEKLSQRLHVHRFHNSRPRWASCGGKNPFSAYGVPMRSQFVSDLVRSDKGRAALEAIRRCPPENATAFVEEQGPYSDELFDFLRRRQRRWRRALFVPYLYTTTLVGARAVPADKVVVVLAAHNETMIHLSPFREYGSYRWGVFTAGEKEMFARATGVCPRHGWARVVPSPSVARPLAPSTSYRHSLVFVGRSCIGKCVDRLVDQLDELRRRPGSPTRSLRLELVGEIDPAIAPLVDSKPWITVHGTVSTARRDRIVNTSMALVSPSLLDSLGLVNLEAAYVGTPVLVNTDCPAFAELARGSRGALEGFSIYDPDSLDRALLRVSRPAERMRLAKAARDWATDHYTDAAFERSLSELLEIRPGR